MPPAVAAAACLSVARRAIVVYNGLRQAPETGLRSILSFLIASTCLFELRSKKLSICHFF